MVENRLTRDLARKKARLVTFCDVTRTNNVSIALASIRRPYQDIKVRFSYSSMAYIWPEGHPLRQTLPISKCVHNAKLLGKSKLCRVLSLRMVREADRRLGGIVHSVQEALSTMDLEWLDVTQMAGLLTALPDAREAGLVEKYLKAFFP